MDSQINLTVSLVMIALFSIAIIGFAIGFANDNDSYINIADDSNIMNVSSATRIGVDNYEGESEDTYSSISETTIEPGSDVVRSPGSFTITWSNVFSTFKNIIELGYLTIFGSGGTFGIFLTAFLGIILFMVALYLIKTWRGNP